MTPKRNNRIARILLGCTIAVVIALGLGGWMAYRYITAPNPANEPTTINIPSGTTIPQVRAILIEHLDPEYADRVADLLDDMTRNNPGATIQGLYVIQPGQPAASAAKMLAQGRQTPIELTFNNLRLTSQLAARVASVMATDSAAFMQACYRILPEMGYTPEQFPAAFIPDKYQMYWTASADDAVRRLVKYRDQFWNSDRRAKAQALGLTPVQVATIASIVEEESNKVDEWPTIARLYLNRLDPANDMPLQADPTLKFAAGDFAIRRVTDVHKKIDSPYNTYAHKGLPPGPIRIPSKAAIDAVLDAPVHDYLFMCAKEDFSGYHNFTRDYQTHLDNAARYHRELDKNGIK